MLPLIVFNFEKGTELVIFHKVVEAFFGFVHVFSVLYHGNDQHFHYIGWYGHLNLRLWKREQHIYLHIPRSLQLEFIPYVDYNEHIVDIRNMDVCYFLCISHNRMIYKMRNKLKFQLVLTEKIYLYVSYIWDVRRKCFDCLWLSRRGSYIVSLQTDRHKCRQTDKRKERTNILYFNILPFIIIFHSVTVIQHSALTVHWVAQHSAW